MSELRTLYVAIIHSNTLESRMDDGRNGQIAPWSSGWLVKTDRDGMQPQVDHELAMYQLLDEEGLMGRITPTCDFGESYDGQLVLQRINDCVSLGEYAMWCSDPRFTRKLWVNLCESVGLAIRQFHDHGFTHCDLHAGNVVCELEGDHLRPFLIDFGCSYHTTLRCEYLSPEIESAGQEADVDCLIEALEEYQPAAPDWYQEGLDALYRAALCE